MDITNTETARQFINAWKDHTGAAWHIQHAANSQRSCAALSISQVEANRHLAAARTLDQAAKALQ